MVELMVSAILDSGYYATIRVRVVDLASSNAIVERKVTPVNQGVPQWFVSAIGIEAAGVEAMVSRAWQQAAWGEVVSHPMFALAKL